MAQIEELSYRMMLYFSKKGKLQEKIYIKKNISKEILLCLNNIFCKQWGKTDVDVDAET